MFHKVYINDSIVGVNKNVKKNGLLHEILKNSLDPSITHLYILNHAGNKSRTGRRDRFKYHDDAGRKGKQAPGT